MRLFNVLPIRIQIQCFWLQDIVYVAVPTALNKRIDDRIPILQKSNSITIFVYSIFDSYLQFSIRFSANILWPSSRTSSSHGVHADRPIPLGKQNHHILTYCMGPIMHCPTPDPSRTRKNKIILQFLHFMLMYR